MTTLAAEPALRAIPLAVAAAPHGAENDAAQRFETGFLAHSRLTATALDRWLQAEPDSARAHAMKAFMLVLAGRSELKPAALAAARQAIALAAETTFTERLLADAAMAAADGDWLNAACQIETLSRIEPEAVVLVKLSHALRFMLGDKAGLLATSESALARVSLDNPQRGFVLGMRAFALEESGHYAEAERTGRMALTFRPDDAWGIHAVSHAQEMTGQVEAGVRWIEARESELRACNNFGGHLFWHLALFRLEQGRIDEVLALYDREIRAEKTDDFRDIANAVSLLARLEREGHAVGNRWDELAEKAEARITDRAYVFADLHYVIALVGAGRMGAANRLAGDYITSPRVYAAQQDRADDIGRMIARAITIAPDDPKMAFRLMLSRRGQLARIGGSDAQRDVFEQIMIDCGIRAGENEIVERILRARLTSRCGQNAFAAKRLARLGAGKAAPSSGGLGLVATLAFGQEVAAGHRH